MSLSFQEIPRLIPCRLHPSTAKGLLGSFSIDSRTLRTGNVFIALKTEKADGHDFVRDALNKGAQALFVERKWFESNRT